MNDEILFKTCLQHLNFVIDYSMKDTKEIVHAIKKQTEDNEILDFNLKEKINYSLDHQIL